MPIRKSCKKLLEKTKRSNMAEYAKVYFAYKYASMMQHKPARQSLSMAMHETMKLARSKAPILELMGDQHLITNNLKAALTAYAAAADGYKSSGIKRSRKSAMHLDMKLRWTSRKLEKNNERKAQQQKVITENKEIKKRINAMPLNAAPRDGDLSECALTAMNNKKTAYFRHYVDSELIDCRTGIPNFDSCKSLKENLIGICQQTPEGPFMFYHGGGSIKDVRMYEGELKSLDGGRSISAKQAEHLNTHNKYVIAYRAFGKVERYMVIEFYEKFEVTLGGKKQIAHFPQRSIVKNIYVQHLPPWSAN